MLRTPGSLPVKAASRETMDPHRRHPSLSPPLPDRSPSLLYRRHMGPNRFQRIH
ncbi:hypothetical protein DPMN_060578 [Dreissena polymorpha]|uniref:Uncharacterized protein n=1 Tax=Dreissena polymorpha TaxID=45954 RepID=A0A9D4HG64_DREPO|nr:hypothetical protein DPMN_060578 [Dreissena polymorpha]